MGSRAHPIIVDEDDGEGIVAEDDTFLGFVDYARMALLPEERLDSGVNEEDSDGPSWSWVISRILKTCITYSSGVTPAILLSDLFQAWNEQLRTGASKRRPECVMHLKKKHKRTRLPNTVTIDSIYEKKFLSTNSILEVVIVDVFLLPGTNIYMLSLGDVWSSNTIDLYLHRCCLRTATEGSGFPRLLPTEYLVILLDEDQDEDAMLLGAQFCSDSFSSISLDAVRIGVSYSFYARIESIGSLEIQGKFGRLQRKKIMLVDNDGVKLKFLLWGEQVIVANLFSVGSMLALDRPFIASAVDSAIETNEQFCLEYGSATQLYLVPFIQREEQVCLASTQNRCQGSRLINAFGQSQHSKVSQVMLPCDSQGSIDFRNYPYRPFVIDLCDKMTGISLYGVVRDIFRERSTAENVFSLIIEDTTGTVLAKLCFVRSWSMGRLSLGHTIYISGLTCSMTKEKLLEASWFEKDVGASIVNLSCLPALLNSSCLHKLSYLSDLSSETTITHICCVQLNQIEHCHVSTRFLHAPCGHFVNESADAFMECYFCNFICDSEVVRTFHLKITIADESAKIFAWCMGQTAAELLQISPDEFYELPEEEQAMYPSSLENERFRVAIVNCKRQGYGLAGGLDQENDSVAWEITWASKCE
uniref:Nucleic acid-binding proteins superfamily n=1 Tax=Nelumbo nucifera TaxID=4432 RepID=A0A822Z0I9_NELNU|nr:TPA_asm: hypothetical protein HUJ06_008918 [Nelumbo nucifera]